LLNLTLFAQELEISSDSLVEINELIYPYNNRTAFSGKAISRYKSGKKMQSESYVNGQKEGKVFLWYECGQLMAEYSHTKNLLHDTFTLYHPNGHKMQQGKYVNGKENGEWRKWYANGKPEELMTFRNGEKHGRFLSWHENGQQNIKGRYKNNYQHGLWRKRDENGKSEGSKYFRRGKNDE